MHMSDALLSPVVGGIMWGASIAVIAASSKKLKGELDDGKVPLMGALGAFIFAAQMINFSIPGTGSSGHIGGAMLLAILLGPYAAFLVLFSVLVVQALFFADGGILALGANIFNMGFFACFLAYPLIYRPIAGLSSNRTRTFTAAVLSSIIAVSAGAFFVVLQTVFSGISSLPFGPFTFMMLPIHAVIGLIEGIVTGFIVVIVTKVQPEVLAAAGQAQRKPRRNLILGILAAAIIIGGLISWFASENPDGLEWSVERVTGSAEIEAAEDGLFAALLPDYNVDGPENVRSATSFAGLIGGIIILTLIMVAGVLLRKKTRITSGTKDQNEGD